MKCESLEMLIRYIYYDIMKSDYDRYITMTFGEEEIVMSVFETEIPIKISLQNIYYPDGNVRDKIIAEVYIELCRVNIGAGWLEELDKICHVIEENDMIFRKLFEKGKKEND